MEMDISLTIVGMGGVGSFLMAPLSKVMIDGRLGVNRVCDLTLVDGDSYETKNMSRQFFPSVCNGMNKATAQKLVLNTLFPSSGVAVVAHPVYITTPNVSTLFPVHNNGHVLVSLVDNHACRALLSHMVSIRAALGQNILLITGGNEVTDGSVGIQGFWQGISVGVDLLARHPEVSTVTEGSREGLSCLEISLLPGGEQTMEANMMVAMLVYSLLLRIGSEDMSWISKTKDIYFNTNPPGVRTVLRDEEEESPDGRSLD